ncbi:MAG: DUF1223 domain-containing protein [Paracoccaceae bacterium]|nr:DUF1223 domain-containing protein [Paracoccaceae bacterium]
MSNAAAILWLALANSVAAQPAATLPKTGNDTVRPDASVAVEKPASATQRAVVVELFTSEGCSSCPPADEVFSQLVDRTDVIPLALHVDYWDYIGWTDKFGSPEYTERQRAYANAAGSRTIYTPQLIIDGVDRIAGARPMALAEMISQHRVESSPITLTVARANGGVQIDASSTKTYAKKLMVEMVRYKPAQTVDILRGENAGRKITYNNIVTGWHMLGTWDGAAPISMQSAADGTEPVVVIVQESGPGKILAAAVLR